MPTGCVCDATMLAVSHTRNTVIYGMVIVDRNFERTNQNDGFKMTVLQSIGQYNNEAGQYEALPT